MKKHHHPRLLTILLLLLLLCRVVVVVVSSSSSLSSSSSSSSNTNYSCIQSQDELYAAVDAYLELELELVNIRNPTEREDWIAANHSTTTTTVANVYGYPINTWCFHTTTTNTNTTPLRNFSYTFSTLRNPNMQFLFIDDISSWDMQYATSVRHMFSGTTLFAGTNLSHWNVSNVLDFSSMFEHATLGPFWNTDLSTWNVASATTMNRMFYHTNFLPGTQLSMWNVSQCTDFGEMFSMCVPFQQNLCSWTQQFANNNDVVNVTHMFRSTSCPLSFSDPNLTAIPISPMCDVCFGEEEEEEDENKHDSSDDNNTQNETVLDTSTAAMQRIPTTTTRTRRQKWCMCFFLLWTTTTLLLLIQ